MCVCWAHEMCKWVYTVLCVYHSTCTTVVQCDTTHHGLGQKVSNRVAVNMLNMLNITCTTYLSTLIKIFNRKNESH